MPDGITELALMFQERNNVSSDLIVIGKVVQTSPLKIADGNEIILNEGEELIVTKTVQSLIQSNELKNDDRVLLIADNQIYAAIDKVV